MPNRQDQRIRALFEALSVRGPLTPELIRKVRRIRDMAARVDCAVKAGELVMGGEL